MATGALSRLKDNFRTMVSHWVGFGWHHRIFLGIQIAFVIWAIHLWIHVPQPGWSIAIMAVVAAAMSVHGQMRGWQKAIWMVLIGVLLIVELRAISKDRRDAETHALQDRQRQEIEFRRLLTAQNIDFTETSTKLKTAIANGNAQFTRSMQEAEKVFGAAEHAASAASEAVREATGGDSFAYVQFDGYPPTNARAVKVGEAPLYDVRVKIFEITHCQNLPRIPAPGVSQSVPCQARYPLADQEMGNFPIGSSNPGFDFSRRGISLTPLPPPSSGGPGDLDHICILVEINARNGDWEEMYWARRKGPHLYERALRVYKWSYDARGRAKLQIVRSEIRPDYPKELMEFDPLASVRQ